MKIYNIFNFVKKNTTLKYFLIFILILFIFEIVQQIRRDINRYIGYKKAKKLSLLKKKPLLVIGSPSTGGWTSFSGIEYYGCGDICIDLIGCNNCKKSVKTDVYDFLKKQQSNTFVIFESCVLEAIDNEEHNNKIIKEIKRVSGGDYKNVRVNLSILNYVYFPYLFNIDKGIGNIIKNTVIKKY